MRRGRKRHRLLVSTRWLWGFASHMNGSSSAWHSKHHPLLEGANPARAGCYVMAVTGAEQESGP